MPKTIRKASFFFSVGFAGSIRNQSLSLMRKHERMTAFIGTLEANPELTLDPCYQGYFRCFNEGRYYEAHDVLEHLWLATPASDDNFIFYKGLIQLAGAFVHLRKQHLRPDHPKDGRRLRPAVRLFALGLNNLAPFRPRHLALNIEAFCAVCEQHVAHILRSDYTQNPWLPERAPQVHLEIATVEA